MRWTTKLSLMLHDIGEKFRITQNTNSLNDNMLKIDTAISNLDSGKVDKGQGSSNSGKILRVAANGDLALIDNDSLVAVDTITFVNSGSSAATFVENLQNTTTHAYVHTYVAAFEIDDASAFGSDISVTHNGEIISFSATVKGGKTVNVKAFICKHALGSDYAQTLETGYDVRAAIATNNQAIANIATSSSIGNSFTSQSSFDSALSTMLGNMPSDGVRSFGFGVSTAFGLFAAGSYFGTLYKVGTNTTFSHAILRRAGALEELVGMKNSNGWAWLSNIPHTITHTPATQSNYSITKLSGYIAGKILYINIYVKTTTRSGSWVAITTVDNTAFPEAFELDIPPDNSATAEPLAMHFFTDGRIAVAYGTANIEYKAMIALPIS